MRVKEFPELVEGLKYFLRKVVRKSDIASKQDKETVKWGCKLIGDALSASAPEVAGE